MHTHAATHSSANTRTHTPHACTRTRTHVRAHAHPQAEQARLREDFARQADAMDRLAKNAGAAALERDRAWQVGLSPAAAARKGSHGPLYACV